MNQDKQAGEFITTNLFTYYFSQHAFILTLRPTEYRHLNIVGMKTTIKHLFIYAYVHLIEQYDRADLV